MDTTYAHDFAARLGRIDDALKQLRGEMERAEQLLLLVSDAYQKQLGSGRLPVGRVLVPYR